eukprot:g2725.t1
MKLKSFIKTTLSLTRKRERKALKKKSNNKIQIDESTVPRKIVKVHPPKEFRYQQNPEYKNQQSVTSISIKRDHNDKVVSTILAPKVDMEEKNVLQIDRSIQNQNAVAELQSFARNVQSEQDNHKMVRNQACIKIQAATRGMQNRKNVTSMINSDTQSNLDHLTNDYLRKKLENLRLELQSQKTSSLLMNTSHKRHKPRRHKRINERLKAKQEAHAKRIWISTETHYKRIAKAQRKAEKVARELGEEAPEIVGADAMKPDLFFAFNAGFAQDSDLWQDTLEAVLSDDVLLVATANCPEDQKADVEFLESIGANFVNFEKGKKSMENPFSSRLLEMHCGRIARSNMYVHGVRGFSKEKMDNTLGRAFEIN